MILKWFKKDKEWKIKPSVIIEGLVWEVSRKYSSIYNPYSVICYLHSWKEVEQLIEHLGKENVDVC
jgi:hypothetical protein